MNKTRTYIRQYSEKEIFNNDRILNRLKFLTNGGWGRNNNSRMIYVFEGRGKRRRSYKSNGVFFLAYVNLQIVGWAYISSYFIGWKLYKKIKKFGLSVDCYVETKFRNQGIGTKLIKKSIKYARQQNKKVWAFPFSKAGYELYKKFPISNYIFKSDQKDNSDFIFLGDGHPNDIGVWK